MKNFKKLGCAILTAAILLTAAGCSAPSASPTATTQPTTSSDTPSSTGDEKIKIGVIQYMPHAALDASYQGFVDALKDAGYEDGKNIALDFQNASGEQTNCLSIADNFINDDKDMVLAIATPAAQAIAMKTTDIPILVTAVTDPQDSGLVETNEKPNRNVSGTSDLTPIAQQFDLLVKVLPDAKKVALLYTSGESNSIFQADLARKAAANLGLETIDATVSNSNEIQQVVTSIADQVDAVYAPTDNMIALAMPTVVLVTNQAGIPVICGEEGMVEAGGLLTYGMSYYDLGYKTGKQAVRVFNGEDIAQMPIEYLAPEELTVAVNKDVAELLNITIPADILAQAQ